MFYKFFLSILTTAIYCYGAADKAADEITAIQNELKEQESLVEQSIDLQETLKKLQRLLSSETHGLISQKLNPLNQAIRYALSDVTMYIIPSRKHEVSLLQQKIKLLQK